MWQQLGSPTSIGENSNQEYRLIWFIWSNQHHALQDSTVSRLVWCARLGNGLTLIFLVLGAINGTLSFHS